MSSLKTTHRWCLAKEDATLADELSAGLQVAPLVARIMVAHGIESAACSSARRSIEIGTTLWRFRAWARL